MIETPADYMAVALTACLLALFVALLWPTEHTCRVESCPHKRKGGPK